MRFSVGVISSRRSGVTPKWNPADKDADITLSNNDLTAAGDGVRAGVRALNGYSGSTAKITFSIRIDALGSGLRIGVADNGVGKSGSLSSSTLAIVYSAGGAVESGNATLGTAATFTGGDVIDFAFDFVNDRMWVRVNLGNWNNSGTANPSTNTGGFDMSSNTISTVYPLFQSGAGADSQVTLVPTSSPPSGFTAAN